MWGRGPSSDSFNHFVSFVTLLFFFVGILGLSKFFSPTNVVSTAGCLLQCLVESVFVCVLPLNSSALFFSGSRWCWNDVLGQYTYALHCFSTNR